MTMADAFKKSSPARAGNSLGAGYVPTEARTLRRRRSAASAALLSRPSMLTLGDLVPSFETCVLVYATSWPAGSAAKLVYALFEPNFLVDGVSSSVRKLDRASWERLRSHVEELRIVALQSRCGDALEGSFDSSLSGSEITNPAPLRKPDCMFDLSVLADEATQRSVSHIYLQPKSYTSVPARSRDELLEIEIHGPSDATVAEERRICLPTQVRAVLNDAEELTRGPISPMLTSICPNGEQGGSQSQTKNAETCARILQLFESPRPSV